MTKSTVSSGNKRYGLFRSDVAETFFETDCLQGKVYSSLAEANIAKLELRKQLVRDLRKLIVVHEIDEQPVEGKSDDSYILG